MPLLILADPRDLVTYVTLPGQTLHFCRTVFKTVSLYPRKCKPTETCCPIVPVPFGDQNAIRLIPFTRLTLLRCFSGFRASNLGSPEHHQTCHRPLPPSIGLNDPKTKPSDMRISELTSWPRSLSLQSYLRQASPSKPRISPGDPSGVIWHMKRPEGQFTCREVVRSLPVTSLPRLLSHATRGFLADPMNMVNGFFITIW